MSTMQPIAGLKARGSASQVAPARAALLLFGSGLCALIYQTTWLREFRLIFGGSTIASAAVLAIFMGGLGLGGALLGRRADTSSRPLAFYARLELLIALSAALSPMLLMLAMRLYVATGGAMVLGTPVATVVRLLLALLVLGLPTILMGGTLPAAVRAVQASRDSSRHRLALVYGANTLGGVTGALLATFFLLETVGNRGTLWTAAAANLLVGWIALRLSRGLQPEPAAAREQVDTPAPAMSTPAARWFVLVAAAVVGFAFFLMEIVWFRMLTPLLGGTTYTFGLILAVALLGIGAGGLAYALFGNRMAVSVRAFSVTCALEALSLAAPFALGDRIAVVAILLRQLGGIGFFGHILAWSAITGLVVLPASFAAGVQFPMLIALLGQGRARIGEDTGLAYAWNTAGSIAGSLTAGFFILPLLSAPGAWRAVVILLAALSAIALVAHRGERRLTGALFPAGSLLAALLLVLGFRGPTAMWRHSPIGVGRATLPDPSPNQIQKLIHYQRRAVLWETDGLETCVGLSADTSLSFIVNGKVDGSARLDAGTQVALGLAGPLFHPHPTSAMVIGLGTGSTAGWLAAVPSIQRVDVAELEPAILHVADVCTPVNHGVLTNPKVHITIGDAREILLTTPRKYDLIISEPSNPYRAGIASLFTREYYEAARARMEEGGLFLQWMQGYEVDSATIQTVYVTLHAVFPFIETWQTEVGDIMLVASQKPLIYDADTIRTRLTQEPFRDGFEKVWRTTTLEGIFARYAANPLFARTIAESSPLPPNSDDLNRLEFSLARNLGMSNGFTSKALLSAASSRRMDRPAFKGPGPDWPRALAHRPSMFVIRGTPNDPAFPNDPASAHAQALVSDYLRGDMAGLLAHWKQQPDPPLNSVETEFIGEAFALAGDPAAETCAEALRADHPVEAGALIGILRFHRQRFAESAAAFESAFLKYRQDPWALPVCMFHALGTARELAAADPTHECARRLAVVLSQPFAIMSVNERRLATAVDIAQFADPRPSNTYSQAALHGLEPHPPWDHDFLLFRAKCYKTLGDPLADRARADLLKFLETEPKPLE